MTATLTPTENRVPNLPAWFLWFGLAAAVVIVLHGTNWADEGFWSPGGGYVIVVVATGLLWSIVTSVLLFRAPLIADPAARPSGGVAG